MLIEVVDTTLVERLKRLLPRPDAPLDAAIKALLEKSTAPLLADKLAHIAAEVAALRSTIEKLTALDGQVAELKSAVTDQLNELKTVLEALKNTVEIIWGEVDELKAEVAALKAGANCGPMIAVPLSMLTQEGPLVQETFAAQASPTPQPQPASPSPPPAAEPTDGAQGMASLERLKQTGKQCFTFGELKQALGYQPGGNILRKLKKKEEGGRKLYCL